MCLDSLARLGVLSVLAACAGSPEPEPDDETDPGKTWVCTIEAGTAPPFAEELGCEADFETLASEPLDASIPGARSAKTVVDRQDDHHLYFQNSQEYLLHWDFCSANLSGDGHALVPDLSTFNGTEYTSPERRFILGAVTFYSEPQIWAWELSPYDTADADMIAISYRQIRDHAWFGEELYFHPTSEAIAATAAGLPDDVKIVTTDELFKGITYQPLNLGTSMGQLSFYEVDEVSTDPPGFRETVVLPSAPNDIPVVAGIITDAFQTPLSHINVLSQNRGTPNMAYNGAWDSEELRALEGKWVELTVGTQDWSIREVTQDEADQWWDENRPEPLDVTPMDLSITAFTPAEDMLDLEGNATLGGAITESVPAFGGKASHFGAMTGIGEAVPMPSGYGIPVYWYNQHMEQNDLWPEAERIISDAELAADRVARREALEALREQIIAAPLDPTFEADLRAWLDDRYPDTRMRFRSSTNAEDVTGFNGAGLYTSVSGHTTDPDYPLDEAVREVWASVWSERAYEEREYFGIAHRDIGMALLSHPTYIDEYANGVAITANVYDTAGLEPAFYVNVQLGDNSVVLPDPGVTTDQFLYYFDQPNQPTVYLAHSNLVDDGDTVLTSSEVYQLGQGLSAIHAQFLGTYGSSGGFYGMDVEFKFVRTADGNEVRFKQARPYPGWGG